MPQIRASLNTILQTVRQELARDAAHAAGNGLLSKDEQRSLGGGVLAEAAEELRAAAAPGARVTTDALVETASERIATLLGAVNQPSGTGASAVSQAEVRALVARHADAGQRVARAYELITGKRVDIPSSTGIVPPPPGQPALSHVMAAVAQSVEATLQTFDTNGSNTLTLLEIDARSGLLADVARQTPGTPTIAAVTNHVMTRLTTSLSVAGISGAVPFGVAELTRFVESAAPAAEVALLVQGVEATTGARLIVGDWHEIVAVLYDRIAQTAVAAERNPNRNNILSAAERANLPAGAIRDAAESLNPPVRPFSIATKAAEMLRDAARAAGIPVDQALPNPRGTSGYPAPVAYSQLHLERMIAATPKLAGLLADAHALVYGQAQRPTLPGLPAPTVWP